MLTVQWFNIPDIMDLDIVDGKNNSTAVGFLVFYGQKFYHKLIFLSYHIKL